MTLQLIQRFLLLAVCSTVFTASAAARQGGSDTPDPSAQSSEKADTNEKNSPSATGPSDAERIARLRQTIEETNKHLEELRGILTDPDGEYAQAERDFETINQQLTEKRQQLKKHTESGEQALVKATQADIETLEVKRKLAKDRFDLAIQERKTLQEQITTLEDKLRQDDEALRLLVGLEPVETEKPSETTEKTRPPGPSDKGDSPAPPTRADDDSATGRGREAAADSSKTGSATSPPPGAPADRPTQSDPTQEKASTPAKEIEPPSEELIQAQGEAQQKKTEAEAAERDLLSLTQRIAAVHKSIGLEQTLLDNARSKARNAREAHYTLSAQAQQRMAGGAPQEEVRKLWADVAEAEQRYRRAQNDVDSRVKRLDELQNELQSLQADRIAALEASHEKRAAAEGAKKKVERLENPFSIPNMAKWIVKHGPKLTAILVGMFGLLWLSRLFERRIVRFISKETDRGTQQERQDRAKTLISVFHNTVSLAIVIGGLLMFLVEVGVNVIPLLGGAAVAGLAVAFGAQNLIRDYFSGFMILMENQYAVNDVVKIGGASGLVERITLRVTVLRDLEGVVHFIPHGEIKKVSNMTHGWSRALFSIGVAYKENVDRVIEELIDLGKKLRCDPEFQDGILDDPVMLGLDSLSESSVIIKFFIKTRPLKQWAVRRELLRRIKNRFDEIGIEIPFPHRVVFHRVEDGASFTFPGMGQSQEHTP